MLFEREGIKIFVYREPIDMRAGFERLHEFCVQHMRAKINEGHVYVFFGKNRSRMKCLMYDGSGLVLIAKRIERRRFMSHAELLGRTEISMSEFRQIFHGGVVGRPVFGIEADELDMKSMESSPLIEKILSTQRERLALPAGLMNALLQGDGFRESQTTDR